jgi:hypothetical protein
VACSPAHLAHPVQAGLGEKGPCGPSRENELMQSKEVEEQTTSSFRRNGSCPLPLCPSVPPPGGQHLGARIALVGLGCAVANPRDGSRFIVQRVWDVSELHEPSYISGARSQCLLTARDG